MKQLSFADYKSADNFTLWLNLNYSFTLDEIQDFLNRKRYELILHTAVHENLEHRRSEPGTGSTEYVGNFNTERTYVIAVKQGDELPSRFTQETLKQFELNSVFQKELRKNLLS